MMILALLWIAASPELIQARDKQDVAALERAVAQASAAANARSNDAAAQYAAAVAHSFLAEVALELRDKGRAERASEGGIPFAQKAVKLDGGSGENHRILGTLCGQVIPANLMSGFKWGKCAMESIDKALELAPKSAIAHVSKGVGHYYLPPAFGGGTDLAIKDFERAIQLDGKLSEAWMWLGIAHRKAGRNREAVAALKKASELNPKRVWIRTQLEKTPQK